MYQEHRCYYWANLGEHYTGLVTLVPGQVSFKKLGLLKDKCERKKKTASEFSGGPMVRTHCFHCHGLGPIPGQGVKIIQAGKSSQKIIIIN